MQGLLYGVRGDRWTPPEGSNSLMRGLSRAPMRLQDLERPTLPRDDWCVAKTRLTGICGSDAKMVFMDFGDDFGDDGALNGFFTFPTVFGHEVVADVVEVGPAVTADAVEQTLHSYAPSFLVGLREQVVEAQLPQEDDRVDDTAVAVVVAGSAERDG